MIRCRVVTYFSFDITIFQNTLQLLSIIIENLMFRRALLKRSLSIEVVEILQRAGIECMVKLKVKRSLRSLVNQSGAALALNRPVQPILRVFVQRLEWISAFLPGRPQKGFHAHS